MAQRGVRQGMRHHGDAEAGATAVPAGEADAVDGDRTFLNGFNDVTIRTHEGEAFALTFLAPFDKATDAIDMTADQMPTKAVAKGQGSFQIHPLARAPRAEGGLGPRFAAGVEFSMGAVKPRHSQADTVGGDAIAQLRTGT